MRADGSNPREWFEGAFLPTRAQVTRGQSHECVRCRLLRSMASKASPCHSASLHHPSAKRTSRRRAHWHPITRPRRHSSASLSRLPLEPRTAEVLTPMSTCASAASPSGGRVWQRGGGKSHGRSGPPAADAPPWRGTRALSQRAPMRQLRERHTARS